MFLLRTRILFLIGILLLLMFLLRVNQQDGMFIVMGNSMAPIQWPFSSNTPLRDASAPQTRSRRERMVLGSKPNR